MILMNLTETLKRAIETSGQSRESIARETGVDRAALSRFVNGNMGLSLKTADILADYFGYALTKKRGRKWQA